MAKKKKQKTKILHFGALSRHILLFFLSKFSPKHTNKTFDFSLFPTIKR